MIDSWEAGVLYAAWFPLQHGRWGPNREGRLRSPSQPPTATKPPRIGGSVTLHELATNAAKYGLCRYPKATFKSTRCTRQTDDPSFGGSRQAAPPVEPPRVRASARAWCKAWFATWRAICAST